ncbi:Uncharacterised protein [Porphyromonas cangingivalis]|nr:Uncharacterised protein [Porphyromonas cangingivalis]
MSLYFISSQGILVSLRTYQSVAKKIKFFLFFLMLSVLFNKVNDEKGGV